MLETHLLVMSIHETFAGGKDDREPAIINHAPEI
jgi:hypothetical protein